MKAQLISISEAARLVGKTRGTIARAARGLTTKAGPKGSKLYDANVLLMGIYRGNEAALLFDGDRAFWEDQWRLQQRRR